MVKTFLFPYMLLIEIRSKNESVRSILKGMFPGAIKLSIHMAHDYNGYYVFVVTKNQRGGN